MAADPSVDFALDCTMVINQCLDKIDPEIQLTQLERDVACREAIAQHWEHVFQCNIKQASLDAYKFTCWYGWALLNRVVGLESDKADKVIKCTVKALNILLSKEFHRKDNGMGETSSQLLRKMLRNEWGKNERHGIGQNGLYVAYHCAASPA